MVLQLSHNVTGSDKILLGMLNEWFRREHIVNIYTNAKPITAKWIYWSVRNTFKVLKSGPGRPTSDSKDGLKDRCCELIHSLDVWVTQNPSHIEWTKKDLMERITAHLNDVEVEVDMVPASNRPRRATLQLLKRLLRTTTDAQLRSLGLVRRRPGARARPRASMPCTPTSPSAIATGVQVDGAVPVGVSIKDGACTTHMRTLHWVQVVKELIRCSNPDNDVARRIALCTCLYFMGFSSRNLVTCTWAELRLLIRTGTLPQGSGPGEYRASRVGREILVLLGEFVQKQLGRDGLVAPSPNDPSKHIHPTLHIRQSREILAKYVPLNTLDDIRRC